MLKPVASLVLVLLVAACGRGETVFDAQRVAHAGGSINGTTYTNSLDALDFNIARGFRYFEIDFSFTEDDRLVCIHDWGKSFKRSFDMKASGRPTLQTFRSLVRDHSEFRKCTLDDLADWMKRNPEAMLITDVKDNNIAALRVIARKIPDAESRVIPQIYQPGNYKVVREMGFESIIWTLYRYGGSTRDVLEWVERFQGAFAVTMPVSLATTRLPARLAAKNIPTYVHTINDRKKMDRFINHYGVTEIYTDFLHPSAQGKE